MNGLLHVLDRVGQSLALLEQRCADLEAQVAAVTAERDQLKAQHEAAPSAQ